MAERRAAEDEFNPRHRIVGAVILVALAVIFLPMLLSDHPPANRGAGGDVASTPDSRVVEVPVPPPGDKPDTTRRTGTGSASTTPPPTQAVTVPVEPVRPAPIDEAPGSAEATRPAAAPPAKKSEPTPAKTVATAAPPAASATGKWVIQAGAFSQLENARHLQERLRQKGFAATLDPANPAHGKTVKVLVGPYPDAAAAKSAAARIHSELGIQGIVRSR